VNETHAGHRQLSVAFLLRSSGFPLGMAATNRVRLLGRALIEQGVDVRVFCTRVSERPGSGLNARLTGECDGIPFTYTTGSTMRSGSFAVRRFREVRGSVVALLTLKRLHLERRLDCVYLPEVAKARVARLGPSERLTASEMASQLPILWLLRRALGMLGIPIIVELNELPAAVTWFPPGLARHISQLSGATGVTPISDWLREWTDREATRLGRSLDTVVIPIVVDVDEQPVTAYPRQEAMFVYSASAAYYRSVAFIFRAMKRVWERHPRCRITMTGVQPDVTTRIAKLEGMGDAVSDGRVVTTGYLERPRLLDLYRDASALLAPLHDDLESRARFPTKVGEYLAAARPVVTTAVGEIPRFLTDGETAFVAAPDDEEAFAARLIEVLDDPDEAERVGLAGRQLAEELFDYKSQGPPLAGLIEKISRTGAKEEAAHEAEA